MFKIEWLLKKTEEIQTFFIGGVKIRIRGGGMSTRNEKGCQTILFLTSFQKQFQKSQRSRHYHEKKTNSPVFL